MVKIIHNTNFITLYWQLLKKTGVKKSLLLYASILIALASLFQMIGIGLVVPLLNGLVDDEHFRGIITAPLLGDLIKMLPFEQNQQNIFIFMLLLIFTSVVFENLFIFIGRYISTNVHKDLIIRLRELIFSKLVRFNKNFFQKEGVSEVNTLMINFIESATRTGNNVTVFMIQGSFALIFLVLMFIISWKLTLISLLLLPVTHFFASFISKKIKKSAQSAHDSMVDFGNYTTDVFNNLDLVQINNCEKHEEKTFSKLATSVSYHSARARIKGIMVPSILDVINAAGALIVVASSVFLFFSFNSYSIGRLLVFFVSLRRFISNVQQFVNNIVQTSAEVPHLEKIIWALNAKEDRSIVEGTDEFNGIDKKIKFDNVSFDYGNERKILDNINVEIKANTVTALVGPTGAGKTTIINLIARFYDPVSGSIEIDDVNIKDFKLAPYRKSIGLVSQNSKIFNNTIRYNIEYGRESISEEAFRKAIKDAQLENFINLLPEKENTIVGSGGVSLSGGEMQRLTMARAILKDPKILILDEATSSLDAKTEADLDKALEVVLPNRTVFVVAHRLMTIKNADLILYVDNGNIKEKGTFEELVKKEGSFYEFALLQHLIPKK